MTFFRRLKGRHVGILCVVGGVPALAMPTVFAADSNEGRKVKISELPLYDEPDTTTQIEYRLKPPSAFQEAISKVRQAVWEYLDSMQGTTQKVSEKLTTAKDHSIGMITYIQEDPSILPKAGLITVAGLGGIVAGYRGGIFRKVFLSGSAMTAATALCYPNEAVAMSSDAYKTAYDYAISLWEGDSSTAPKSITTQETVKPAKQEAVKMDKKKLEDHGQSKPEDKDMYTTRGS